MLPAPVAHVPRVRDARAESVWLPQAEQVLAAAAQVHQADITASPDGAAQIEGLVYLYLKIKGIPQETTTH